MIVDPGKRTLDHFYDYSSSAIEYITIQIRIRIFGCKYNSERLKIMETLVSRADGDRIHYMLYHMTDRAIYNRGAGLADC